MGDTMYVLAGGKGDVGRTTTALNTGITLEREDEDLLDKLFTDEN